jgi:hypothetical protein
MNYDQIFPEALQQVLDAYKQGEIHLLSESDLQAHLFCKCISLLKQNCFPHPLQVYAERGVFEKRKKIDLVIGDNEVLVELKFEPDAAVGGEGRVFTTIKDAGGLGYGSVEEDLQKIEKYAKKGKHGHFVMIDETGYHSSKIVSSKWIQINKGKRQAFLLHIYAKPEP